MEQVDAIVDRIDSCYILKVETTTYLSIEPLNLYVQNFKQTAEDRVTAYLELVDNEFYKTDELGAYKNQIYLDINEDNTSARSKAEIRLCLSCQLQDDIRNIFIRVKK